MITYRLIELVVKVMQSSCAPRSRERPNPIAIFIVLVLHKKMTILSQQRCTLKKLMLRVKQSLQRLAKICISFSNLFESSGQKVEAKRVSFFLVPNQTAFFFFSFFNGGSYCRFNLFPRVQTQVDGNKKWKMRYRFLFFV